VNKSTKKKWLWFVAAAFIVGIVVFLYAPAKEICPAGPALQLCGFEGTYFISISYWVGLGFALQTTVQDIW
jgi:hypothetical protein